LPATYIEKIEEAKRAGTCEGFDVHGYKVKDCGEMSRVLWLTNKKWKKHRQRMTNRLDRPWMTIVIVHSGAL